jgi:Tfp pilus assembly protein PilN
MDEVSAALPSYTWLTSIVQTSTAPLIAADTSKAPKDRKAKADTADVTPEPMRFHVVGNTVDIQALTHFMKQLEASPFIQRVTLAKSTITAVDGKEVTQFELDAEYQLPEATAIRSIPVALSVR